MIRPNSHPANPTPEPISSGLHMLGLAEGHDYVFSLMAASMTAHRIEELDFDTAALVAEYRNTYSTLKGAS